MSEPGALLLQADRAQRPSLWTEAPAWRNLTVGATIFTAAAVLLYTPSIIFAPSKASVSEPRRTIDRQTHPVVASTTISPTSSTIHQHPQPAAPPPVHAKPSEVAINQVLPLHHTLQIAPAPAQPSEKPTSAHPETVGTQTQPLSTAESEPVAAPQQTVCLLSAAPAPNHFSRGTVMAFEDKTTSLARIKHNEAMIGGQIDPDFIDNQRVSVKFGNGSYQIFIVPKSLIVRLGDSVTTQSLYKNINRPCEYIPPLITADLGPPSDKDNATVQSADH